MTVALPFADRAAAGEALAAELQRYRGDDVLVLGLPRGGVVVAAAVARRLGAELDVLVARKLGSPVSPELAIGAVTADGARYLNRDVIAELGVPERWIAAVTATERAEAERRERLFRPGRAPVRVARRTVILVDDGLATGATMRAAARAVRRAGPGRLVIAVPVGSLQACADLRAEADDLVCLHAPADFGAVGSWYIDFEQTADDEVERLLGARPGG